jgi:integrase
MSLALSLLTKELSIARGRSAAMTAHSEKVRMSLYQRVAAEGLSPDQQKMIFSGEMRAYRDALDHETARWNSDPALRAISATDRDLVAFETLWAAFAQTGVEPAPSWDYADEHFADLDEEERSRLRLLVRDTPTLARSVRQETLDAMVRAGVSATEFNRGLSAKLVMMARSAAARACRLEAFESQVMEIRQTATLPENVVWSSEPAVRPSQLGLTQGEAPRVPSACLIHEPWRSMSPTQVAERLIEDNPKMFEHRRQGKRAAAQTGEQTLRQIRWAARLLEMSLPHGTALASVTVADIKALDRWFDKLPTNVGKSPQDRAPNATLEGIATRATDRVELGDLAPEEIGLLVPTANKHFRKLALIHEFLRQQAPDVPAVAIRKFIQADDRDERAARLRYTVEQATAIFALPPWVGCAGVDDRLSPGSEVFHDSLFFVLILVWYTGARREELCKLRVADVGYLDGIWFVCIENTETGRNKNASSARCVPLADEVIRLGFAHYIEALRVAGETLVFPELEPAEGTKRKRGDVFCKLWWIYIRALLTDLKRGQAMHAARHAVSDELKQNEVLIEFRNDLLGQRGTGGDGETRYPSRAGLRKLLELVTVIPVVTKHVATSTASAINLLPAQRRGQRPSRKPVIGSE